MRLLVAPASHVAALLEAHEIDLVVSLISPNAEPPELLASGRPGLILRFNDIAEPREGLISCASSSSIPIPRAPPSWPRGSPACSRWRCVRRRLRRARGREFAPDVVVVAADSPDRDTLESLREAGHTIRVPW
jgi:hypothetical protein